VCTWGAKKLRNKKKIISKGLLKKRFNFDPSKIYNYHLVTVSQNKISHLAL
jgi:hypothetical protein